MKQNSILTVIFTLSVLFMFSCSGDPNEKTNTKLKGIYDVTTFQVNNESQLIDGVSVTMEFTAGEDTGGEFILDATAPDGSSMSTKSKYSIMNDGTVIVIDGDNNNLTLDGNNVTIDGKSDDTDILLKGTRK